MGLQPPAEGAFSSPQAAEKREMLHLSPTAVPFLHTTATRRTVRHHKRTYLHKVPKRKGAFCHIDLKNTEVK